MLAEIRDEVCNRGHYIAFIFGVIAWLSAFMCVYLAKQFGF